MDNEKNGPKFYLFIITSKYTHALPRVKKHQMIMKNNNRMLHIYLCVTLFYKI
jgi:hypothetical protein